TLEHASEAVAAIIAAGILPATLEMMDNTTINVVEDYLSLGLPRAAEAMLILEQDGNDEGAALAEVERMAGVCRDNGAVSVEVAAAAIFRAALALGGTLSGEHGIGLLKREFLEEDLGPTAVELMRGIKQVFDPRGMLSPHKVFPESGGSARADFLRALPTLEG